MTAAITSTALGDRRKTLPDSPARGRASFQGGWSVMGLDQGPGQQQITFPCQLRYVVNLFP
jgi:hypothetical protein